MKVENSLIYLPKRDELKLGIFHYSFTVHNRNRQGLDHACHCIVKLPFWVQLAWKGKMSIWSLRNGELDYFYLSVWKWRFLTVYWSVWCDVILRKVGLRVVCRDFLAVNERLVDLPTGDGNCEKYDFGTKRQDQHPQAELRRYLHVRMLYHQLLGSKFTKMRENV